MEVKEFSLRRDFNKYVLILVVCLLSQWTRSQTLNDDLQEIFEDFQIMGMSVWVDVQGASEDYHYGFRDFERNLPVTDDTHYRIASVSKSFAALGLLKLYDDGFFELDDDIADYLPYALVNPNHEVTPITFRMLLSHRTGLQDGDGYNAFINATFNNATIPDFSELVLPDGVYYTPNMWRSEVPGTYFTYSNVNFALVGTLIEAVSGERFDVFMKEEILNPLGINGSYNVLDVDDINNVSVLYRFQEGIWEPQWDNYQGMFPQAPDLEDYIPGTNGLYFGPQGSLRISASDTGKFLAFIASGEASGGLLMSSETLDEMSAIAWEYDGNNGDNYFGLFNRWGLGLHHANANSGDVICNLGNYGSFIGHPGEAYGLVSDAYYGEDEDVSFTLIINGVQNGYQVGNNSAFYTVEEAVFEALCTHFEQNLAVQDSSVPVLKITPNPAIDFIDVLSSAALDKNRILLYDFSGKNIDIEPELNDAFFRIPLSGLSAGIYFLSIGDDAGGSIVYKIVKI